MGPLVASCTLVATAAAALRQSSTSTFAVLGEQAMAQPMLRAPAQQGREQPEARVQLPQSPELAAHQTHDLGPLSPRLLGMLACGAATAAGAKGVLSRRARAARLSTRRYGIRIIAGSTSAVSAFTVPLQGTAPATLAGRERPRGATLRGRAARRAAEDTDLLVAVAQRRRVAHALGPQAAEAMARVPQELLALLGPPQPANAFELDGSSALKSVSEFFFDPRLQWDENGNILKDPQGNDLPDNLWTQFVAVQATLIKRLDQAIPDFIPGSLGIAVALYTLLVRVALYPFIKGQLETTAKIQVLAPRVNELKEKYKDNEERMQQEVGMLYMDLQIDPLAAILPLLLQLPIFWGLYRGVRRLAIVEYEPLKEGFLWIPSLYGPNFKPDPSFDWLLNWKGPLIELAPKIGWDNFLLYSIMPVGVVLAYREVLKDSLNDEKSPKILQIFPFFLGFICVELPQAMGIYIATNLASSVALTTYTKNSIAAKIPGYQEFVDTGKWPPGVDPEKVLAKAFGVQRLTADGDFEDPASVPEAVFSGRADYIPTLLEQGRKIDEFDNRGIPASAYTLALDNEDLLVRLFELGADPLVLDKKKNSLLHYCCGYGRSQFLPTLLKWGTETLLNQANDEGQTPLDVARMNLSQSKVADDCRKAIKLLEEKGAAGKTTTQADEEKFEKAREQKEREAQVKNAKAALMALAKNAGPPPDAGVHAAQAHAAREAEESVEKHSGKSAIEESLQRVQSLDIETIRERLGGKLTEEQLEKLSSRLSTMSPEDLAEFASGMKVVRETASQTDQEAAPELVHAQPAPTVEAPRKVSALVD
jgi:YidC/Oxa1 family membrane protein insertase